MSGRAERDGRASVTSGAGGTPARLAPWAGAVVVAALAWVWLGLLRPQAAGREESAAVAPRHGELDVAFPVVRAGAPPSAVSEHRLRDKHRQRRRDASDEHLDGIALVRSIGGSQPGRGPAGVIVHDPAGVEPGLHLVTSAHGPEALLLDDAGRVVHAWRRPFDAIFPEWANPRGSGLDFWRRVHLLPDGDLLVVVEDSALVRLDVRSEVRWTRALPVHGDVEVTEDGSILVVARGLADLDPHLVADRPNAVEHLVVLDLDGEVLDRVSLVEAHAGTASWSQVAGKLRRGGDSFHTTSLEALGGGRRRGGLVLFSNRHLGTIAALELGPSKVRWSRTGPWQFASDARWLGADRLLVLDNGSPSRASSRLIEVDGRGGIVWQWAPEAPAFAGCCGSVRRLAGGNTLATFGEAGFAVEVTPEGEVVWELRSGWSAAEGVVATLFEVERIGPERLAWLPEARGD